MLPRRFPLKTTPKTTKPIRKTTPKATKTFRKTIRKNLSPDEIAAGALLYMKKSKPGKCFNCNALSSVQWRIGGKMCNACGLFWMQNGVNRPKKFQPKPLDPK